MNLQSSLPRLGIITEALRKGDFPSAIQLSRTVIDKGHESTPKSIQQDITHLRDTFGIDVLYHKGKDGYFISEKGKKSTDEFLDFLGVSRVSEIIGQALREEKAVSPYVSFEHEGLWAGTRWLPQLVQALKSNHWIGFDYRKFESDQTKHYSLMPLLLKQYQGRWYLIGRQQNGEDRTFGIDRIEELKIRDQVFTAPKGDPRDRFVNVVGLDHSRGKVETVRLSCEPVQAQYLKTLPLHISQKIIRDSAHETVFEVKVIPNYEFLQRILMMGAKVKVLQPQSLATEVYSHLIEAAKQYE